MESVLNGARVHWETIGEGRIPVLMLHGWGADISLMKPVAEKLTECTSLMLDFPGFGQSGRPPEPWAVADYVAAVEALIEAQHFTPCAVVAHSFGCRVAVKLAAKRPELLSKLVLTGAAGLRKEPTEAQKRRSAQYQRLKRFAEGAAKLPGLSKAGEHWREQLRQKYGSADYNALDEEMRKTFVKVVNEDLAGLMPKIQQPTLLVFGDQDTETPLWMGERMVELIPDAGLVTLKGGSHFAYLEQLGAFTTIVQHFLTEEE